MARKFEELRAKMSPARRARSDKKAVLLCADADIDSLLQRLKPLVREARGEAGLPLLKAFQALDNAQTFIKIALKGS